MGVKKRRSDGPRSHHGSPAAILGALTIIIQNCGVEKEEEGEGEKEKRREEKRGGGREGEQDYAG